MAIHQTIVLHTINSQRMSPDNTCCHLCLCTSAPALVWNSSGKIINGIAIWCGAQFPVFHVTHTDLSWVQIGGPIELIRNDISEAIVLTIFTNVFKSYGSFELTIEDLLLYVACVNNNDISIKLIYLQLSPSNKRTQFAWVIWNTCTFCHSVCKTIGWNTTNWRVI